jgi:hypothetical protein
MKKKTCKIRSLLRKKKLWRPLAQLVEQLAFNQFVEGSNPSRPTNFLASAMQIYYNCDYALVDDVPQHHSLYVGR